MRSLKSLGFKSRKTDTMATWLLATLVQSVVTSHAVWSKSLSKLLPAVNVNLG